MSLALQCARTWCFLCTGRTRFPAMSYFGGLGGLGRRRGFVTMQSPSKGFQRNSVPPHEILGVTRHATIDEIKQAYRERALRWHPDRNPHDQSLAASKFREATQAYLQLGRNASTRVRAASRGRTSWRADSGFCRFQTCTWKTSEPTTATPPANSFLCTLPEHRRVLEATFGHNSVEMSLGPYPHPMQFLVQQAIMPAL
eukprot:Gregarina_sp_Poly_1__15@NODE_1003_length_5403_cov_517_252249_g371_i1_p3_GENE_NODE_1003_length_5403_cov_517_252249_g371_i1NODE_1003_length_5403_cov_517_252249_g371_i1_p3_ORF_typecomplete_len199_score4_75DnaJ/PF00226_31/5_5e16TIG_plexin/PF17960_1/0_039_NODE_1003_length_5403_cov_517_252249_g371_i136394235